nr:ATP phosphoribosyltransferase regulatory subunit [Limosilactobacillus difficilis]
MPLPRKFYYLGEQLSIGRQLSGQRNEITQAGLELVGFDSLKAEIECLLVIQWISQQFLDNQLTIELGNARLVNQVLATVTTDQNSKEAIAQALFNKNFPRYQELVAPFKDRAIYPFLERWPRLFGTADEIKNELAQLPIPDVAQPIIKELTALSGFVHRNFPKQQVIIDLSTSVPQKYYTGVIFKGYTSQSSDYVISGGRYDNLLANFQKKAVAAIGLGINVDLLSQLSPLQTSHKNKLVYSDQQHFERALQLIRQHPNYSLAIASNLAGAKKEAQQSQMELIVIGDE